MALHTTRLSSDYLEILHLSDVHFGCGDGRGEVDRITNAVVKACRERQLAPDLLVFSGDLAFSGRLEEFQRGQEWLSKILELWPQTGLFLVPGNHDVDREAANLRLRQIKTEEDYNARKASLQAMPHLRNFFEWHEGAARKAFGERLLSDWSKPFGCMTRVSVRGRSVNLIGLNTAALACDEQDKRQLVQDIAFLNKALAAKEEEADCVVAVGHHPLAWLSEWNETAVAMILQQEEGAHVYLHGHQHEQESTTHASAGAGRLTTLECGAAYQSATWPKYFSEYVFDFSLREIMTSVFLYAPSPGEWIGDESRSQSIIATLPRPLSPTQPKPAQAAPPAEPAESAETTTRTSNPQVTNDDDELSARRALERAECISEELGRVLADPNFIDCPIYNFGKRVKTLKSTLRKVTQKRATDASYNVSRLEDLCGCRYVLVFQRDVPLVVDRFLGLGARSAGAIRLRDFAITVHTSRPPNDPLSITTSVENIHRKHRLKSRFEVISRSTGYSSVHVTATCEVTRSGEPTVARVELQVRSVLEEFWGQLDHRLRYETSRGKSNDLAWHAHLNVLKTFFDGIVQYVDNIRDLQLLEVGGEKLALFNGFTTPSTLSFSKPDDQLALLAQAGLPPETMKGVTEAFRLWKIADASRQFGGRAVSFRTAADAFEPFLDATCVADKTAGLLLSRIAQMERAYLLLGSSEQDALDEARAIYERVIAEEPAELHARFRLGQVLLETGFIEEAIKQLDDTIEQGAGLPLEQVGTLLSYVRLSKGLAHFRIYEAPKSDLALRNASIKMAIRSAQKVKEVPSTEAIARQALNDLAYYAWEERTTFPEDCSLSEDEFRNIAASLIAELKTGDDVSFREYDTLTRLHQSLGDTKDAMETARKTCELLHQAARERSSSELQIDDSQLDQRWFGRILPFMRNSDERDSLICAWGLLQKSG